MRCRFWQRRRRVKLHLEGAQPSVEGILDGKVSGWFLILDPKLHHAPESPPIELKNPIEIDSRRVVFLERLA